jgi:DNA-binding CsgD family transcriptional regulator
MRTYVRIEELEERIRELLVAGEPRTRIARRLGISRGTVSRHAAMVGFPSQARTPPRFDWTEVRAFYTQGHSVEECKRHFGFSSSTWEAAVCRGDVVPRDPQTRGRPRGETREKVAALLTAGVRLSEIARRLGLSKPTISYHARRLGIEPDSGASRRYNWEEIRCAYESGLSVRQCMKRFGFCLATWHDAVKRGAIVPRPAVIPMERLLVVGRKGTNRTHLKNRLVKEGLKEDRCETCGIIEWLGKPLSLELHHVNGDGADNRLENLQLLCGNCHSQTDNWGGRGIRRKDAPNSPADCPYPRSAINPLSTCARDAVPRNRARAAA